MVNISIKFRLLISFQNRIYHAELAHLLRVEVFRRIQYLAVAIAENVSREPARQTQAARAQHRSQHRFHQRLPRLEVFSGDGQLFSLSHFPHCRDINARIRRTHHERRIFRHRRISVAHRRRHVLLIVSRHRRFERGQRAVYRFKIRHINFRRSRPQHHNALTVVLRFEAANILTQLLHQFEARTFLNVFPVQA